MPRNNSISLHSVRYSILLFLFLFIPKAMSVVDHTLYLHGVGFSVQFEGQKPLYRTRPDGVTYVIKGPYEQKALLHTAIPEKLYGELLYSILSEAIGLPNNTKYPTFVTVKNQLPVPLSTSLEAEISNELTLALYEPMATYLDDAGLKTDSKALSELIMHLSLLYLFGAESIPYADKFRYPIRLASGERDFRSRSTMRSDHHTLVFLPNLKSKFPMQLLTNLSDLDLSKSFFSSNAQKDTISFLNTYTTFLESIPDEQLEKLLKPLESVLNKPFTKPFLEKRRHLRSLLSEFFETLKFNREILSEFKNPISIQEPSHILLPQPYPNTNLYEDIKQHPIRFLWNFFFTPKRQERQALILELQRVDPKITFSDILKEAQIYGENFYSITPHLSQRSLIFDHQTQLNQHRYQTLVVTPFNDMESKIIHNIARKLGSHSLPLEVPHGYELSIKDAVKIVKKAKEARAKTIMLVELPGKIPQVEALMKREGFNVVIIDHHSHGLHNDRTHRLSSLEQFASHFGYKLSPREYIAAVMDRSFIYGLNEVGLNRQEALDILKSISQEDYYALEKNLTLFMHARKVNVTLQNGAVARVYIIENKHGKLVQVTQAAALLEFPEVANVLVINKSTFGESILFSGIRELSELFKKEFIKWRHYPNQFSGGNQRNVGYWGIDIRADQIKGQLSVVSRKVYDLIGLNHEHYIRVSEQDEQKFTERRQEILSNMYRTQIINTCREYFN